MPALAFERLRSSNRRHSRRDPAASGDLGYAHTWLAATACVPTAVALLLVGIAVAVITEGSFVRGIEARSGATVARLLGLVPARALGSAVVFPIHGRLVGYTVSEGCTVAYLVAPLFVIAAMLIASRRTPPRRGLIAVTVVTGVFFAVNQARLFVITASMRLWGFESGFERSHIFLGTILSTLGAVAGLVLFVRLIVKENASRDERGDDLAGTG